MTPSCRECLYSSMIEVRRGDRIVPTDNCSWAGDTYPATERRKPSGICGMKGKFFMAKSGLQE